MHELSIAQNIIEIVRQSLGGAPALSVRTIRISVGALTSIHPESLRFCLSALVGSTDLAAATLDIRRPPIRFACRSCGAEEEIGEWFFRCPSCGGGRVDILSGNECTIDEIELLEETAGES